MMLSLIRIMWITGIRQNVEITISSRLLEPEQSPAEDGSHLGEKLFWGRKKKKSTIFNLFNIYPCFSPHANIPAVSCLTGATAESIIQHVSKTPHHISAEEKKKSPVPSPNQFGSWNSAERERLWENAAAKLPSRIAVKLPVLAVRRGGQVLNNQDILSPAPTVDTAGHV